MTDATAPGAGPTKPDANAPAAKPDGPAGQAPAAAPAPEHPATWSPPRRRWAMTIVILLVALAASAAVLAAWGLWPFTSRGAYTNDAYVKGDVTTIAPEVSGYIQHVDVRDYEIVRAGQKLFEIDPSTFQAQAEQAKADLDLRLADLANNRQSQASARATVEGKRAALASAQAQYARDLADRVRDAALVGDGSVSRREYEQAIASERAALASVKQARADLAISTENVRSTGVQRQGLDAQVEAARASLRSALINLSRTRIVAPKAGQLGEVGTRLGQYVASGTQLTSLVPPERWVVANYKETRIRHVRVGQAASVWVDALGGRRFDGVVLRISPATGSEFSAIKPDNSTGNFVKIPQRIGIYIAIRPNQPGAERIAPGMSVETQIAGAAG